MMQVRHSGRTIRATAPRKAFFVCAVALFCVALGTVAFAQPRFGRGYIAPPRMQQPRPPRPRINAHAAQVSPNAGRNSGGRNTPAAGNNGARPEQHLQDWIKAHQNLTVEQRVQALQQEPGFSELPANTQQRMIQRMRELSAMTPEQLQTRTQNIEAMERMTPQQRQQMSGALRAISNMPEDRQRLVRKAFRDLREVPVEQRNAMLNSDRFRSQFTDHERAVLGNLMAVEPYMPPARPNDDMQYGR